MLSGIRVVECCQMVAGPYCARILADMGAEVIKVEKPGSGDISRGRGPFPDDVPDKEKSSLFLYANTNKLGATLNLDTAAGRELFLKLIGKSDILLEDEAPEILSARKLDYVRLSQQQKSLIVASITPFGETGPYHQYRAYPLNTYHSGGVGYLTPGGWQDLSRPPLQAGGYFGEYQIGLAASLGVLVALYSRMVSGAGQHIDMSKQEALIFLNGIEICRFMNEGLVANRRTRAFPFGGIMPCKDGYLEVYVATDAEWNGLIKFMGNPEWSKDPRFADGVSRAKFGNEINGHITEWLGQFTKEELYLRGQKSDVTIAPYRTIPEVLASRQMKARGFFQEIEQSVAGKVTQTAAPYHFSETPPRVERPAPQLGEHNDYVYGELLGVNKAEMAKLRRGGII